MKLLWFWYSAAFRKMGSQNSAENNVKTAAPIPAKLDMDIPYVKARCANFFRSDPLNFGDFTHENSDKFIFRHFYISRHFETF